MKRLGILALFVLVGCGGIHPPVPPKPSPTPIPSPTPVPPVTGLPEPTLLHTKGAAFINAEGKRVYLEGYGGTCCHVDNDVNGWTDISESYLKELAAHGGNFVHIRTGPYSKSLEPRPEYRAYNADGSFNEGFYKRKLALIRLGRSLGVYFEIDVGPDGWSLKDSDNNFFGWTVDIMRRAPKLDVQHFVQKNVKEFGDEPNVIWQLGNENGVPQESCILPDGTHGQCSIVTLEYELGIADAIRIQEDKNPKRLHHLKGTNAGLIKVDRHGDIDYIETHQCQAPEMPRYLLPPNGPGMRPVMVNECNPESFTNFQKQLGIAEQNQTYYQLWISDMPESQRQQALDLIATYRKTHQTH